VVRSDVRDRSGGQKGLKVWGFLLALVGRYDDETTTGQDILRFSNGEYDCDYDYDDDDC
jgi:hypothetical protein